MITKNTAQKIAEVCESIEDCEEALKILESKRKCEIPLINVCTDLEKDGINIFVPRAMAVKFVMQVLEHYNAEYSSLNKKALKEG